MSMNPGFLHIIIINFCMNLVNTCNNAKKRNNGLKSCCKMIRMLLKISGEKNSETLYHFVPAIILFIMSQSCTFILAFNWQVDEI